MNTQIILGQTLGSILSIFPFSFMIYLLSERLIAIHQSRVGIGISTTGFFKQGLINLADLFRKPTDLSVLLVTVIQFSFIFLISFFNNDLNSYPLQGGFIICLLINLLVFLIQGYRATYTKQSTLLVYLRIQNDQRMIKASVGSLIALICIFATFAQAGSWSISEISYQQINSPTQWGMFWSPIQFLFLILFQVAGMLIFEEHPFGSSFGDEAKEYNLPSSSWIASSRFYVWSLLGSIIYLGGGSLFGEPGSILSFVALQIKAGIVYLVFRLVGMYFPKHLHSEIIRVCLLYVVPASFGALMLTLMLRGLLND